MSLVVTSAGETALEMKYRSGLLPLRTLACPYAPSTAISRDASMRLMSTSCSI